MPTSLLQRSLLLPERLGRFLQQGCSANSSDSSQQYWFVELELIFREVQNWRQLIEQQDKLWDKWEALMATYLNAGNEQVNGPTLNPFLWMAAGPRLLNTRRNGRLYNRRLLCLLVLPAARARFQRALSKQVSWDEIDLKILPRLPEGYRFSVAEIQHIEKTLQSPGLLQRYLPEGPRRSVPRRSLLQKAMTVTLQVFRKERSAKPHRANYSTILEQEESY